ncbi:RNA-directed DNA polymerase [Gammaproteobacteria bacterium]
MPFVSCARDRDQAAPFGFASVWRAWLACRRRKRGSRQAQLYELNLLDNIQDTALALQQRRFSPSRSYCFVARQPKAREIHAAIFGDRVVHHLLVPWLERFYEPVFIHDSYSNRKGKGTHAAVARLEEFMRANQPSPPGPLSLKGRGGEIYLDSGLPRPLRERAYFLQLDIANFFNSIDRRRLFGLLRQRIERDLRRPAQDPRHADPTEAGEMLWLARVLLTGNPATRAIRLGPASDFERVPPHKRLSLAPPERGLPIGNLTSQFFANVYLNELDQFVKHTLKCQHYVRYVDDFVCVHRDPAQLLAWRQAVVDFLHQHLDLRLKELPEPQPVSNGANFLGYIVRPHYRLVRRRVVDSLRAKLDDLARVIAPGSGVVCLEAAQRETLRATLASYLGHFRHARHHRLIAALWRRYPWLGEWFGLCGQRLIPRWEPRRVNTLLGQWRYFSSQWPEAWVLMQIGNRLQVFDAHALQFASAFRYPLDRVSRTHFDDSLTLRFGSREKWMKRLRAAGQAYCLVVEEGYLRGGMPRDATLERGSQRGPFLAPTLQRGSRSRRAPLA